MVRQRSQTTRAELLHAAALEISERGYSGASFSSVAARLGLTKGAFAYHFPTKQALAVALMEEFGHAFTEAVEQARKHFPGDSLHTALRALRTIEVRSGSDPLVAAAFTLMLDPQPPVDEIYEKFQWWLVTFEQFLSNAEAAGQVSLPVPLEDAAEFLIVSLMGLSMLRHRTFGTTGVKEQMHLRLLFTALGVNDIDKLISDALEMPPGACAEGR